MEESSPGFPAKLLLLLAAVSRRLQREISFFDVPCVWMCGIQGYSEQLWLGGGARDNVAISVQSSREGLLLKSSTRKPQLLNTREHKITALKL